MAMKLKRTLSLLLVLLLALSCLLTGCSTPTVAMQVADKTYLTADYLAYMYGTIFADSTAYSYLYYYGEAALKQEVTYGDDQEKMPLEDYIVRTTQDTMIRQKALEDLMKKYNVQWDAEMLKEVEEQLSGLKPDQFLWLGFNNQRYTDMYKAVFLNEASLFDGLYGVGGEREIPETDIRTYFDNNFLSYMSFEVSLTNSDKSEFSEAQIAEMQTQFQGYLDQFNATGKTVKDFNVIYKKYLAETEESKKTTTTTGTGTGTATTATSATTTATTTTTTTATTTTTTTVGSTTATGSTTGTTATTGSSSTTTDTEDENALQRQDVVAEDVTDTDFLKALQAVPENTAGIQVYKKNGTTKTMALIFRLDPEAQRDEGVNYYEDCKTAVREYLKYDEFDAEVKKYIADTLNAQIVKHESALKAAKPADMVTA